MTTHEHPDNNKEEHEPETTHPHIWIASLADYNNGRLHGEWIDATQEPEDLERAIWRILASSREPDAEEWAIHDYDGFGPLKLGEYESLDDLSTIANGIAEHGPAFAAWVEIVQDGGGPLDHDLLNQFSDHYMGSYESAEAWAQEMCDDFGYTIQAQATLPETIQRYVRIDYQAFANDMKASGEIDIVANPAGGIWAFRTL